MKQKLLPIISGLILLVVLLVTVFLISILLKNTPQEDPSEFTHEVPIVSDISNPFAFETSLEQGDLLFQEGNFELAAEEYQNAIEEHPEHPEAQFKLSQALLGMNEFEEAQEHAQTAVNLAPTYLPYSIHLLHVHLENLNLDAARLLLSQLPSDDQSVLYYRALFEIYDGQLDLARADLETAAQMSGPIPFEQMDHYLQDFRTVEAQIQGQDIYLKTLLAQSMVDFGEYGMSIKLLELILKENSNYRDAWSIQAYAHLQRGEYDLAQAGFLEAIRIDGNRAVLHYYLGLAYLLDEQEEDAIASFKRALLYGLDENLKLDTYEKLAETYLKREDYENAIEAYEFLLNHQLEETMDDFVEAISIALIQLEDIDKAHELADLAIEKFPNEAMSYNLKAWVQIEEGELDEAKENLEKALDLNPDLDAAHYNLGQIYEAEKDYEAAKIEYKKAYDESPLGSSIHELAGEAYNEILKKLEEN